jgi:acyl-CoA reductase-like NAD-dependent aldehyde dehydrogenase
VTEVMLTEQLNSQIGFFQRLAGRLEDETGELSRLMTDTLGKPIRYAEAEVRRTAELLSVQLKRFRSLPDSMPAGSAQIRWRPLGTVAVITPANNPVFIPLGKICAALYYGNSVVWKPAPETEDVSRQIGRLIEESGCSAERFRLVEGGRTEAERLLRNPLVSGVTLTGSETTGQTARAICAERNIPLQAELGGNNAAIVWDDAEMKPAARAIVAGAFEMAGQRCTANRRVIVREQNRDPFLNLLIEESVRLNWGDPFAFETDIGPLVSRARCERISATLDRTAIDCPIVHPLGQTPSASESFAGCWCPPTLVCCNDPAHEIVQEETFGPVLVVQSAQDWDQAIELCNGVRQGLAASVFTTSETIVERFLEHARAGMLKINQATSDAEVDVPFCAWKASGSGPPKHGMFTRDFYTRPQTVYGALGT